MPQALDTNFQLLWLSSVQCTDWQKNCTSRWIKLSFDEKNGVMSLMPSNDDIKQQSEEVTSDRVSADAAVSSILPDEHTVAADDVSVYEGDIAPLSSDNCMPLEFTFFQKKKRGEQELFVPSVAHANGTQLTAFATRLDIAEATNTKTQRHIAELMILMSDVSRTITEDVSSSTRKRFCWSKWLFYGCLVGSGIGWFLLSPSGHDLLTQLAVFLLG